MGNTVYRYLISSIRAHRRNDEEDNLFTSTKKYNIGDEIVLDGLVWIVTDIV